MRLTRRETLRLVGGGAAAAGLWPRRSLLAQAARQGVRFKVGATDWNLKMENKVEAVALDEPSAVCRGADIVCECTDAVEPVVFGQWLEPGTHLTYVGRNRLDSEAYDRVDVSLRLTTASSPIGHPEWATDLWTMTYAARRSVDDDTPPAVRRGEGRFKRVISLEDMVSGREQGRSSREQITNATRGNVQGAEFFAIAGVVYEAARAAGVGRELPTEWFLDDVRD